MSTKIEWAEETWNPVTGCTKISEGCRNCYAERMSKRLAGRYGYPDAPHNFDVTLHPDKLGRPLHWRKPRRVFVCSMGDLFHEDVPFKYITLVLGYLNMARQHTFMVLTKRPGRMLEYHRLFAEQMGWDTVRPLPNVWLGVTAENQEQADKRLPILLQTPAAVRFVSVEPMLEEVDLFDVLANNSLYKAVRYAGRGNFHGERQADGSVLAVCDDGTVFCDGVDLDWIICGAETGLGKRPMNVDWARALRDQCQRAGVPFFFKKDSSGSRLLDGREWNEYPMEREAR